MIVSCWVLPLYPNRLMSLNNLMDHGRIYIHLFPDKQIVYHAQKGLAPNEIFDKGLCAQLIAYKIVDSSGEKRTLKQLHSGKTIGDICEEFMPGERKVTCVFLSRNYFPDLILIE